MREGDLGRETKREGEEFQWIAVLGRKDLTLNREVILLNERQSVLISAAFAHVQVRQHLLENVTELTPP